MLKINKLWKNIASKWFLLITIILSLGYLILTLPAFFDHDHLLFNLEPYPDGLYYSLSARNLVLGKGLNLVYQANSLPLNQPPIYSLVLALGYLISNRPESFYLINLGLGLISLEFILLSARVLTKQKILILFSGLFYLSHLYLVWVPSLPMTENIVLTMLTILVYFGINKYSKTKLLIAMFLSLILVLTKFSLIVTTLFFLLWFGLWFYKQSNLKLRLLTILSIILGFVVINIYFISVNHSLFEMGKLIIDQLMGNHIAEIRFYDLAYLLANLSFYLKMLSGGETRFLWMGFPLTSVASVLSLVTSIAFLFVKKKVNYQTTFLILTLVSFFVLMGIFYVADARYTFYAIIPIILLIIITLNQIQNKYKLCFLMTMILLIQIISQLSFAKKIITDNWLGRSTAWQYQAIKHFNQQFSSSEMELLITTLPLFLIDAYQTSSYSIYPLSQNQEFLSKEQLVWGRDINYQDLPGYYQQLISHGKAVYITNAYITHQQEVIKDFENYKQKFTLELVSSGCDNACNIYQLKLK